MTLVRAAHLVEPENEIGVSPSLHDLPMVLPDVKTSPFEIRTVRDLRELETLRSIWKSWAGTRDSDLDVFSSAVRWRGRDCQPHVIVLARNGEPDAILVGLRERKKLPLRLGHITVCQPEVNVLEFAPGGLRGRASAENSVALIQRVVRSLDEGEADLAVWKWLEVDSPLYSGMLQLQPLSGRFPSDDDQWLMDFPRGPGAFLSSLGRSQRSKLRRKYKKVLSYFADRLRVRQFCSVADLELAISAMEEIAAKSEKRRFGWGFFDTQQMREQMFIAAKGGWLRIYVLYLDDKPAAFWMGTLYNRCLQADHVGYDPVWKKFSPGIFLFLNILEDLCQADIEMVDFGGRSSQLKQCFGALRRAESQVHIYAPTLRGVRLSLLYAAIHRANSLVRRTHCLERWKSWGVSLVRVNTWRASSLGGDWSPKESSKPKVATLGPTTGSRSMHVSRIPVGRSATPFIDTGRGRL